MSWQPAYLYSVDNFVQKRLGDVKSRPGIVVLFLTVQSPLNILADLLGQQIGPMGGEEAA